jgi:lauroyl/myristoyl acyltransferase
MNYKQHPPQYKWLKKRFKTNSEILTNVTQAQRALT